MHDHSDNRPLQDERQIDRIAHDFEQALRRGEAPRIEDVIRDNAEYEVPLLRELVLAECEHRDSGGIPADWDHYAARFPQHAEHLRAWRLQFDSQFNATDTTRLEELNSAAATRLPNPNDEAANESGAADAPLAPLEMTDFEIQRRLGKGGQGEVLLARQKSLSRPVAIKQLNAAATDSPESVRRFVREARTIAQIHHPHVVIIHGIGRSNAGGLFLVMEYVEGPDLASQILDKPFDFRQAAETVSQIADAVAHAHQSGVIHRDLKPQNILWDRLRGPVVTDFGLARDLRDADELTLTEQVMGTPAYMAPEQAHRRFGAVTERTDVYGLGAILFATLTGRGPYSGMSLGETLHALGSAEPTPDVRTLRPETPDGLADICNRCLAKSPDERPSSAQKLAEALDAWLSGRLPVEADQQPVKHAWRKPAADAQTRQMFGPYRLLERIDSDATRMIHRAVAADGRQVLLKQLPPDWRTEQLRRSHFRQEVLLATRVRHPCLAEFIDAGTIDDTEYLVVSFVDGESASQRLQRDGAFSEQRAAEILQPIAEVLHQIHEVGVFYRDLRPQNIILTGSGQPILADVRFSTELAFGDNQTLMGWGPISSLWLAPERLLGQPSTVAGDVYSLGATLYALVTGHAPFEDVTDAIAQMIRKSSGSYTPAREFVPNLSDEIVDLITDAMADAPADRPASAAEFAERLEDCLQCLKLGADADATDDPPSGLETGAGPLVLHENAQFSVYRPKAIPPGRWEPMLAFAHLSELPPDAASDAIEPLEEVRRQAEQVLGPRAENFQALTSDAGQPIPHGGELTFVPSGEGLEFNPPSRTFRWLESVHREEFRFRADAALDGQTARGHMSVFLGDILIAEVNLVTRVSRHTDDNSDSDLSSRNSAYRFRRIYACVAAEDSAIAEQFRDYASAMRDSCLTLNHYRGAVRLDDEERRQIHSADVFQLYWSNHSMNSPGIEERWRFALGLNRPEFIRSLYWEEPFPADPVRSLPPAELLALGFQKIRIVPALAKPAPTGRPARVSRKLDRVRKPRCVTSEARLEIMSGSNQGKVFTLTKDCITIGRHPNCDVPLSTHFLSRFHTQLIRNNGEWFVGDMQSRQGTFLNGKAINGQTRLKDGDLIHIENVLIAFRLLSADSDSNANAPSFRDDTQSRTTLTADVQTDQMPPEPESPADDELAAEGIPRLRKHVAVDVQKRLGVTTPASDSPETPSAGIPSTTSSERSVDAPSRAKKSADEGVWASSSPRSRRTPSVLAIVVVITTAIVAVIVGKLLTGS
ncbi:MAG: protein kinase [Planctomycetaceae bacterium]